MDDPTIVMKLSDGSIILGTAAPMPPKWRDALRPIMRLITPP